jgi:glycosyltransferase involved in cell wall biosynthesis
MTGSPKISIVTPSFRSSRWLKLCVASVADQEAPHEHIVQDSCSDDGTQDWLPRDPRVKAFIEKDNGMYDAVNRGFARASGQILAYINCDEQYLPGALAKVVDYFEAHPGIDIVFADTVVVNADGEYLCHRQACVPCKYHTWISSNLAILTCATFFRHSVIAKKGLLFNANLKDVGDAEWIMRLIDNNVSMGLLKEFTSVFTETGANMNLLPNAQREKQEMFASAPAWARRCRPLFVMHHRLRRLVNGHYTTKPFSYALFTAKSPLERVTMQVPRPTFRWVR